MPSEALHTWQTWSRRALDEIEAAYMSVRGRAPGRRFAAQQINQAYVVLLSSQFQRFCRELHTEAVDYLRLQPAYGSLFQILGGLVEGRKLDAGNPNPGNIGSDYGRLRIELWDLVREQDRRSGVRQRKLEELNRWRNAIAHQNFAKPLLGGRTEVRLADVRAWRAACDALAVSFDRVVGASLTRLVGTPPW